MPDIKKGGRLIEDQVFRFLADGASQKNALLLSITRVPEQDVRKVFALHHGKGIPDFFLIFPGQDPEPAGIRIPPGSGHIKTRHKLRIRPPGHDHGSLFRKLMVGIFPDPPAVQINTPAQRRKLTDDAL